MDISSKDSKNSYNFGRKALIIRTFCFKFVIIHYGISYALTPVVQCVSFSFIGYVSCVDCAEAPLMLGLRSNADELCHCQIATWQ